MTRVSLKEAYDNKDVVAQIYAIRDTAESAVDTSEQAVTTANTASDHVDALVPQVEGAVQNANSASASAQASAQTVAGYENRLATVESDIDGLETDLNAVTLRVTTAEGQIVTIQGRVTALETADGQNVKINAINNYAVGLTGNQAFAGEKTVDGMFVHPIQKHDFYISSAYCCLLEYSGRVQVMFDLYTYKGTGSGVIDTVTSSESRGGVTLLDPAGWWTSSTNEFFVLFNTTTGKYEVWVHSTTAVSVLIRALRTYGTSREYGYVSFRNGSTQTADPRTDTSTYPDSAVQIPAMIVRGA